VIDSRPTDGGRAIRRRRSCPSCDGRFTTFERAEVVAMVRKRDGTVQRFDPAKVRRGIERALVDRPVRGEAVEDLVAAVETAVVAGGSAPVSTEDIGHAVLDGLRELDEVAYVRFASVYKEFEGASDFEREVAALEDRA